jgi:hypothetical protein
MIKLFPRQGARGTAEDAGQRLCPLKRAVGDHDGLDAARLQRVNHSPRRAAGAQHQRGLDLAHPARRASVEIGEKTGDVAIVALHTALAQPQGIDCAKRLRAGADLIAKCHRRLLVRHGDIRAGKAALGHGADEWAKLDGLHFDAFIRAVQPKLLQPVAMNFRRARMLDRHADDAGFGREKAGHEKEIPSVRRKPSSGSSGRPRIVD